MIAEGDLLWEPNSAEISSANLTKYMLWLAEYRDVHVSNYRELWEWSVTEIEQFWESLVDFLGITHSQKWTSVLKSRDMPGANWFPGMRLNYAENIFSHSTTERPMMLYRDELSDTVELSWQTVYDQANRLATKLRALGVEQGDRVVAYLPNIPEAIIALLAASSIGAIWSSCAPDFGSRSVLDRFEQIEPKVLIAVDGYNYGGKQFDRRSVVAELQANLPTVQQTILVPHVAKSTDGLINTTLWDDALASVTPPAEMQFAQLPFDHPLWVLYSSGTTGLPKPIVQGHGGIVLEHAKSAIFHNDIRAGDRFFWYSSTGWMMWNYLVGTLLADATIVVYNGSPAYPDIGFTFQLASETDMTYFGTSAAFVSACIKSGIRPNQEHDLSKIRAVGSTGSPLSIDGFQWIYDNINDRLALESLSGGTDLCTAFVGGARTMPIYAGELQGASLGAKVQAWDDEGVAVTDEVGELVIAEPMPSMPLYFWNDAENARYKSSYFEMFPGTWRHGDWIKINERGGCVIYGRSDSTINRQGIRMGTSEIYRIVESFDEVLDSLIIDLEFRGRDSFMPLFVVLREGNDLTPELIKRINAKLRAEVSPRHVPNETVAIAEVPYTLSGKKMEVPIRKILLGMGVGKAANPGAMRNPESVQFFLDYAGKLDATSD